MNYKDARQSFSMDIDAGLHTTPSAEWEGTAEYRELMGLAQALANQDFSRNSNKTAILYKVRNSSNNLKERKMNIKHSFKRPAMIMASLLVAGVLSVTFVSPSFAQEVLNKVLQTINLGHIVAHEFNPHLQPPEFPEVLKGKIFDKNGNPVESFQEDVGNLYTAEGEQIVNVEGGKIITESEQEKLDEKAAEQIFVVKQPAELNKYAAFEVLLPEYLPKGFSFDRGEFYKDEDGVNGKYLNLYFTSKRKGQRISMQQRFADHETAYEMSISGKMERVMVNGVDAIMMNDRSVDWEANGVLYGLSTRGLDRAEVLQIAESIR